jgi:hypothetical protein
MATAVLPALDRISAQDTIRSFCRVVFIEHVPRDAGRASNRKYDPIAPRWRDRTGHTVAGWAINSARERPTDRKA